MMRSRWRRFWDVVVHLLKARVLQPLLIPLCDS